MLRFVLLTCLLLCCPAWAQQTLPLELTVNGPIEGVGANKISVGLTIKNTSDHSVSIEHNISVENFANFRWTPATAIETVASCEQSESTANWHNATKIAVGETLKIVPFNNSGCGRQCVFGCLKIYPLGAGVYRFVVIGSEGQRLPSSTFNLPDWH